MGCQQLLPTTGCVLAVGLLGDLVAIYPTWHPGSRMYGIRDGCWWWHTLPREERTHRIRVTPCMA